MIREKPRTLTSADRIIEGNILIIGDSFLPYDFRNWREAANYVIDRCCGVIRGLDLIEKNKEHLEVRCPLGGEYLDIVGSEEDLEMIHRTLILQNLYRHSKHHQNS